MYFKREDNKEVKLRLETSIGAIDSLKQALRAAEGDLVFFFNLFDLRLQKRLKFRFNCTECNRFISMFYLERLSLTQEKHVSHINNRTVTLEETSVSYIAVLF